MPLLNCRTRIFTPSDDSVERTIYHPSIHHLPVEILDIIFLDVCSAGTRSFSLSICRRNGAWSVEAPVISLTHVCRRWRLVATGLSHLWSSINVDIYRPFTDPRPLMKLYLQNARKRPLTIRMTDSQNTFWPQSGDYVLDHIGELGFDVAWLLLQEARRFGSLDLNLPEDFMYSVVTKACFWSELPDLSFHLLTSFNCSTFPACMERGNWVSATHNNGAVDRADFWFWDAVHDKAPRLTSLITDRLYNTHLLPYHQLTTLKITRLNAIDWQHLLLTLSISPCLRSLSILECYDPVDGEVFRPVVSTSLQHLSIEIWPVLRNLPAMFAFLHLPSLRSLQFRMLGSTHANEPFPCALPPSWPCRPLLAILGSCSASLSQLSVKSEDYTISSEAMGRVLLGVPNLEFLEVNLIGTAQKIFVGEFVARLTPRDDRAPGESVMVPKLRKLFVHEAQAGLRGSPFVPVAESIVRMAEARLRGESAVPLHTVCLSHGCERYTWDGPENLVEELGAPLVGRLEILEATGTLCRVEWL